MKTAINRFAFTKTSIDNLPFEPKGKQKTFYDSNPTDLVLIVSEFSKTFYLQARVKGGEYVKVNLGKFGVLSLAEAKEELIKKRALLQAGINPNKVKKNTKLQAEQKIKDEAEVVEKAKQLAIDEANGIKKSSTGLTLAGLIQEYRQEHLIDHKGNREKLDKHGKVIPSPSLKSLDESLKFFSKREIQTLKKSDNTKNAVWKLDKKITLPDMLDRPYREIEALEILERFEKFCLTLPSKPGNRLEPMKRTHQLAFKNVRAAYAWKIPRAAKRFKEGLIENPFEIIKTFKLWKDSTPRETYLDFTEPSILKWWTAVEGLTTFNGVVRDYIFVSLFQSGRSIEIAPLEWEYVDLKKRVIKYVDTKNNNDYVFPMTEFVYEILSRRFKQRTTEYVFEYPTTKTGYISQDSKHFFDLVHEQSGVKATHHDLRRTMATAATKDSLKIPTIMVEVLLKHKIDGALRHYIVSEHEELRIALQKLEDYFLGQIAHFKNNTEIAVQ